MQASFEEKSVWIQLVAMVVALGGYLIAAGAMLAAGVTRVAEYVPLFTVAVVLLVISLGAGHAVAAILRRPEPRDERDRVIEWRAESGSSWVPAVGIFAGIAGMLFEVSNAIVAHTLLLSLFAATLLKYALQIRFYRRGV